jgi:hypothetical protein
MGIQPIKNDLFRSSTYEVLANCSIMLVVPCALTAIFNRSEYEAGLHADLFSYCPFRSKPVHHLSVTMCLMKKIYKYNKKNI